jgi:YVTN family beta-propeller protein
MRILHDFQRPASIRRILAALVLAFAFSNPIFAAGYIGPDAIVASRDGKTLYVTCKDFREIAVVDAALRNVIRKISLPAEPTGIALSPDETKLYVTCLGEKYAVCKLDIASSKITATLSGGIAAIGPVVSADGKRLYVCNRFENAVAAIDLDAHEKITSIPVPREPCSAALTPDGKLLFAADLIPHESAEKSDIAAVVSAIDTVDRSTTVIRLPNGSIDVRGLCVSADGNYVFVPHIAARYQLPTTTADRGWINANALGILDVRAKKLLNTVLLDDVFRGAATPWNVAATPDGKWICITHAGTHELSVIDARGLFDKLAKLGDLENSPAASAAMNDLTFLRGLRHRVPLEGYGPHGLAVVGESVYIAEYYSDSLAVVNLQTTPPKLAARIRLGPEPAFEIRRLGEVLFNDATICHQHWQSCASCHPDGRTDGLNWDLPNDGLGNPKKARSLVGSFDRGPVMAMGVRGSAKEAVRAGLTHVLFSSLPEEGALAIDEYLRSLKPYASPHLVDGKLSPTAERGKKIFNDERIGCARCHPAPNYSDKQTHDVGSVGRFDKPTDRFQTPTLVELWRTAPYLHDGRYGTVKEIFTENNHGLSRGEANRLSDKEIDDLVEYLLSL